MIAENKLSRRPLSIAPSFAAEQNFAMRDSGPATVYIARQLWPVIS
jgi:hypothetical protein